MKSSVKRNISWTQDWKNQSQMAAQVIKKLKKKNLKQVLTKDFKKCYMTIKDKTSPYKSNFLRVLKKLLAFASCTPK